MRQLFPAWQADVEAEECYAAEDRARAVGRPWLLANMVASTDGATALDGRSGGLGGPADRRVFRAVRAQADVILVAAGTVRAEGYRSPRTSEAERAARQRRGQAPAPRLAIVTASLALDPELPLFLDPTNRPLVITTADSPVDRRRRLAAVADVVLSGSGRVDLGEALKRLERDHGAGVVLSEGGPSLNGALHALGRFDELCLTLSPTLVGGSSTRILAGSDARPQPLELRHVLEEDDLLFLRYRRVG